IMSSDQSKIMLVTSNNQHLKDVPINPLRIFNPIAGLASQFFNMSIQKVLSQVAGKVYVNGNSDLTLADKLLTNTAEFKKQTGKTVVTKDDLLLAKNAM